MREFVVAHRRAIVLVLTMIGLVNATLIVRPWARDQIEATDIRLASNIAGASVAPAAGATPWLNLAKTQLLGDEDGRQFKSATMFLSYFLISTRGFALKCEPMGFVFAEATKVFGDAHAAEYERASSILSGHGLNAEFVWMFFSDQLDRLAVGHLDQLARMGATDLTGICARIVAEPMQFAQSRGYSRNYPELHSTLMQR